MKTKLLKRLRKRFVFYFRPSQPFGHWVLFDKKRVEEKTWIGHSGNLDSMVKLMCGRMGIIYIDSDTRNIPRRKKALLKKYNQKTI